MSAIGNPSFNPAPSPVIVPAPPPPVADPHGPSQGGKPWKWLALVAVIAIGGVVGYQTLVKPKQEAQSGGAGAPVVIRTAKVTSGGIEQTVRVSGPTSSKVFQNVVAPIMRGPESGREMILLFLVQSGARVKKGEKIAAIDAKSVEDHIDDIADDIEKADADIRKRQSEQAVDVESLQQQIRVAKADLDKANWEAKAAEVRTDVEQELLKLTVAEADAKYKEVQKDVQFKLAGNAAELKILEITKIRHERHRNRHKIDLVKFTMLSPMDGLAVVQQMWRGGELSTIQQGDSVSAGQLFMKVVDPTKMQVEANINQSESNLFRINQKATVRLDAFPGLVLPGHIYAIGAIAAGGWRANYFIRNIPVRVNIDGVDPRLIPDLSASGDVLIAKEDNAKQIPLAGVFSENDKEFVFVKTATGFQKREVELGLRNATHASVKTGLEVGEEVALERPQSL